MPGLREVARGLVQLFHSCQCRSVENFPVTSVAFNFDAIKHRPNVEAFVRHDLEGTLHAHLLVPLCDEETGADELRELNITVLAKVHHQSSGITTPGKSAGRCGSILRTRGPFSCLPSLSLAAKQRSNSTCRQR